MMQDKPKTSIAIKLFLGSFATFACFVTVLFIPVCGYQNPFDSEPGVYLFDSSDYKIYELDGKEESQIGTKYELIYDPGKGHPFRFHHKGTYYQYAIDTETDAIIAEELDTGHSFLINKSDSSLIKKISD